MVIDDSLLICKKEIKKALGDEVFICEAIMESGSHGGIAQYQPDLILLDDGAAGYGWIRACLAG